MQLRKWSATLVAMLVSALAGCADNALDPGESQVIESPAAPGSQAPNLASGLDDNLYLSWIEPRDGGHALRFATWNDGGWSTPRTVAEGKDWFVNWADVPSMAALEDGTLAAHWLVRSGTESHAYDVYIALSRDGGNTWSEPFRPHRDGTNTEHGFVSLIPTERDFGVVWLDGRNSASSPPGPITLRYATLLPDGGLENEAAIDENACDCCSTDALRTEDGALLVTYRDRTDSEIRDISLVRLEDSTWSSPRTVHEDNWEISACPVNGPAVAGLGDNVAVVWFSAAQDTAAVRVAFSRDSGRTFDAPIRVDRGSPHGRVDILMLDDGSALVSWLERDEDQPRIFLRQISPSGTLQPAFLATTSRARLTGFPRMARFGDQVILVWTERGDPSRVATAAISI